MASNVVAIFRNDDLHRCFLVFHVCAKIVRSEISALYRYVVWDEWIVVRYAGCCEFAVFT